MPQISTEVKSSTVVIDSQFFWFPPLSSYYLREIWLKAAIYGSLGRADYAEEWES